MAERITKEEAARRVAPLLLAMVRENEARKAEAARSEPKDAA